MVAAVAAFLLRVGGQAGWLGTVLPGLGALMPRFGGVSPAPVLWCSGCVERPSAGLVFESEHSESGEVHSGGEE